MKKVYIVHGFKGSPNSGWQPWLMSELDKLGIWACALPMPAPSNPICQDWVSAISKNVKTSEEVYLVGYSLGSAAILKYLEKVNDGIFGGVFLVAAPCEKLDVENLTTSIRKTDNFFEQEFLFDEIKKKAKKFVVIHGDKDERVPFAHAEKISQGLGGELVVIKNEGHFNGHETLPFLLEEIKKNIL